MKFKSRAHKHVVIGFSTVLLSLLGVVSFYLPRGAIADFEPVRIITGIFGRHVTLGSFDPRENAGAIRLIPESEEVVVGGSGFYIDATDPDRQFFTGSFFLDNVGWVEVHPDYPVELIPREDMNIMTPWLLSGAVWSENAGWIALESIDPTYYTGVTYTPGTQRIDGTGWSENLGYLDFSGYNGVLTNRDFKNKVKILGVIGGDKVFNTEYFVGEGFSQARTTGFINSVRKAVALATRGLPDSRINTVATTTNVFNNIAYYRVPSLTLGDRMGANDLRSIIVVGGDIYIESDIPRDTGVDSPRAIIALKSENGVGGNIYIGRNVKNIYTSIISEGSIYSGESGTIYNSDADRVTNLPVNQLYIYGSLIGRNTIGGGSIASSPVCPFTATACGWEQALLYDLNYFRTFDSDPIHRSDKSGYDEYSIIIEHDPRISRDPPPGLDL